MDYREQICNLANNIQNDLLSFISEVNKADVNCISRSIDVDGNMLIFRDENAWKKFVDVFDILGFDFTTGEPDGEFTTWYIDFEFSEGISPDLGY